MGYEYKLNLVCAKSVKFNIKNNCVYDVCFNAGCEGNLKAMSKLVEGMAVSEVISKLKGNSCGSKDTSCADQFTLALQKAISKDTL